MCGRFTHHLTWRQIVGLYRLTQVEPPPGWRERYNLAPTQDAPVIRTRDGERECAMLRWGLVPSWSKEPKAEYSTINARSETVATKPTYREAFRRRRCLVPASGFYEWRAEPGAKGKQPYYFRRADGEPMTFAGLWERWQKGEAPALETFTIIVTSASEQVQPFHHRMPVILQTDQFDAWLEGDPQILEPMLAPFAGALAIDPVSRAVNDPRNDGPELIATAAWSAFGLR